MRGARLTPLVFAGLVAATAAPVAAEEARRAMREGFALEETGNLQGAAARFEEAAAQAGAEGLDPATPRYNRGCVLLKAGRALEAAAAFAEALRASEGELSARAHYNRGIALAAAAEATEREGRVEGAVRLLGQALDAYESAMRLDPDDEDPKVNHELAFRRMARLEGTGQGRQKREEPSPAGRTREEPPPATPEKRPGPPAREMQPEEARTLLDAMRQQETSQRLRTALPRGEPVPGGRDW